MVHYTETQVEIAHDFMFDAFKTYLIENKGIARHMPYEDFCQIFADSIADIGEDDSLVEEMMASLNMDYTQLVSFLGVLA